MLVNCTCNKGYTGADGQACTGCVAGTFKEVNGSAACSLCPGGTHSGALAPISMMTCEECPSHTHSEEGLSLIHI